MSKLCLAAITSLISAASFESVEAAAVLEIVGSPTDTEAMFRISGTLGLRNTSVDVFDDVALLPYVGGWDSLGGTFDPEGVEVEDWSNLAQPRTSFSSGWLRMVFTDTSDGNAVLLDYQITDMAWDLTDAFILFSSVTNNFPVVANGDVATFSGEATLPLASGTFDDMDGYYGDDFSFGVTAAPEPGTISSVALGLLLITIKRRRKHL